MARSQQRIAEDIPFQRRIWRFQPICWGVMALIVLAGFLGAFGGKGLLNKQVVRASHFRVECERFPAHRGDTSVEIFVQTADLPDPTIRLWVNDEYIRRMPVTAFHPDPVRSVAGDEGIYYEFEAEVDGAGEVRLLLTLRPESIGRAEAIYRIAGGGEARAEQFVYP